MQDAGFKAWCAARQTMGGRPGPQGDRVGGVAPDDIAEIEAGVLPPHQQMVDHGVVAGNRASHLTSLPYQMRSRS